MPLTFIGNDSEAEEKTTEHVTAPETPPKSHRVLLVDDTAMKILLAKRFIMVWAKKLGVDFDFEEVDNGFAAIEAVRTALLKLEQPYALVVMDCELPTVEGIKDGIEAARGIRNLFPSEAPAALVMDYLAPKGGIGHIDGLAKGKIVRDLFNKLNPHRTKSFPAPKILGYSENFIKTVHNKPTKTLYDLSCLDAKFDKAALSPKLVSEKLDSLTLLSKPEETNPSGSAPSASR